MTAWWDPGWDDESSVDTGRNKENNDLERGIEEESSDNCRPIHQSPVADFSKSTLLEKIGMSVTIIIGIAISLLATLVFGLWFFFSVMKELNWK